MQLEMSTIFFILTAVICGIFLLISWKVGGKASESFSQYAIGGASFGMLLIFFSQFASIMGVSNFFAHAGNAYEQGVGIFAFILGEQGSKIFFALLLVGLIGKFTYNTIPEMIDDLIVRDKLTRAMCGVLASIIMISSVGSQGKAFGDLFEVFTGFSSVPIVILFSAIFIFYTVTGGVYSVVWTDLFQGILCLVVGIVFYLFTFSRVDFSLEVLRTRLAAVGQENLLSFAGMDWWGALNKFITGFIGVVSFQAYWQRCFGSKSARTAKRSMFWSGVICLGFVLMTAMTGLVIMTYNQDLNANTAMPWFMMNCMPPMMCAAIFALVLCAGMSTADSCLNSSAVLIVNDVIHPLPPGRIRPPDGAYGQNRHGDCRRDFLYLRHLRPDRAVAAEQGLYHRRCGTGSAASDRHVLERGKRGTANGQAQQPGNPLGRPVWNRRWTGGFPASGVCLLQRHCRMFDFQRGHCGGISADQECAH